jgi:ketosteroid isomerase-like protein
MDTTEHARAVTERYCDVWMATDVAGILAHYADDFTLHHLGDNRFSGDHIGRDAVVATLLAISEITPRQLIEVEEILAAPNRSVVVARERLTIDGEDQVVRRVLRFRIRASSSPIAGCTTRSRRSSTAPGPPETRRHSEQFEPQSKSRTSAQPPSTARPTT